MKLLASAYRLLPTVYLIGLVAAGGLAGCSQAKGQLILATDKDAAWVAKEMPNYPLMTCMVSKDKLGEMGTPLTYIYREAGKPDRLVLFCCKDCPPEFAKEPAKYLKELDTAMAAKAKK